MKSCDASDPLQGILTRDPRYAAEAYEFVRAALGYTIRKLETPRHVSGHELLEGVREFALAEYGPMTRTVLEGWGIRATEDVGEIVFNLVEAGLLGKTERDSRADFADGYDFDEVFRKPFAPASGRKKVSGG